MAGTKNPKNRCKTCGDTWYPRGRSRSLKCPNCGSKEVETVSSGGLFALIVLIIAGVIFFGNNKSGTRASVQESDVPAVTSTIDSLPADQDTAQRAQDPKESTHTSLAVETPSVEAKDEQSPTAGLSASTTEEDSPVVQEPCSESSQAGNCSQTGAVQNNLF